ncbi:unnamed protein product [Vitrella brassicaformis CCMP3155]|uniref:Uncharacterized protein n=1 Tax=Vitrella brassicaformis (strain CCMP3155) TaxID=1169540 RepID=A0A0G4GMQ0_VITBC|nr:unnamed protein product [Vitrella brassicaformis CCMP3155]|eukprot:CEM31466.1 unnamed protein product [Vitrella brassicaformis CCMP3155]
MCGPCGGSGLIGVISLFWRPQSIWTRSAKILPNNNDTLEKLKALHPPAPFPPDPTPTQPPNNAPRPVFDPDDEHLLDALKTAPKGAAQGGRGGDMSISAPPRDP